MTMKTAMLTIAAMTLGTAAFGAVRLVCDYPGGSIVVKQLGTVPTLNGACVG
jgi:hypothetical protein